jgi:hypothetical protein
LSGRESPEGRQALKALCSLPRKQDSSSNSTSESALSPSDFGALQSFQPRENENLSNVQFQQAADSEVSIRMNGPRKSKPSCVQMTSRTAETREEMRSALKTSIDFERCYHQARNHEEMFLLLQGLSIKNVKSLLAPIFDEEFLGKSYECLSHHLQENAVNDVFRVLEVLITLDRFNLVQMFLQSQSRAYCQKTLEFLRMKDSERAEKLNRHLLLG